MLAIGLNTKTFRSFDCSTDCPKRRLGIACPYCYVESARAMGYNAKQICSRCDYNHEVTRMSKSTIAKLNSYGGIRMFSFGDYSPEFDGMIKDFLDDCLKVSLRVKAVTKQPDFVYTWGSHPALSMIHLSVDNVGSGVDWELAKTLREAYPEKVLIRCAIMQDKDVDALAFADVFTFNHASDLKKYGWKKYTKAQVQAWNSKLNGKACCANGGCESCDLHCGVKVTEA